MIDINYNSIKVSNEKILEKTNKDHIDDFLRDFSKINKVLLIRVPSINYKTFDIEHQKKNWLYDLSTNFYNNACSNS